jgi:hypothetical protein
MISAGGTLWRTFLPGISWSLSRFGRVKRCDRTRCSRLRRLTAGVPLKATGSSWTNFLPPASSNYSDDAVRWMSRHPSQTIASCT